MIDDFIKWASEGKRSVDIDIDNYEGDNRFTIWVYDYSLMVGQHVMSVDEIDLEAKKLEKDKEQYESLKLQFETMKAKLGEVE